MGPIARGVSLFGHEIDKASHPLVSSQSARKKHVAAAGSSGSNPLFGVVLELVYGPCGAPSPWSNERPPLGPSGGSPLVHRAAPPLIPLWIGRSS